MRSRASLTHQPQSQPYSTVPNNDHTHRLRPTPNNIISSIRRFLNFHHKNNNNNNNNQQNREAHHQSQSSSHCGSPVSRASAVSFDDVQLPLFKLCNFGVWKEAELGRGYSGVVHRGVGILLNDEENDVKDSRLMALKLSKPRYTHFDHEAFGTPGREFETLKFLYMNGVPVPRPLGFCISADNSGSGRTLLAMELIDGCTLREWINNQTELVLRHDATGRTLHPAKSIGAAIERLDLVIGLIEALQRLHQFGVFVDLKPRNIMIGRHKVWAEGIGEHVCYEGESNNINHPHSDTYSRMAYPVILVDIGGVVLRKDIQRSEASSRSTLKPFQASLNPHDHRGTCSGLERNESLNTDCEKKENERDVPSAFLGLSTPPAVESQKRQNKMSLDGISGCSSIGGCCRNSSCVNFSSQACHPPESSYQPSSCCCSTGDSNMEKNTRDERRLQEIEFNPISHRHLLETTCSYLSPELAAIIVEGDRYKESLINHFHPSLVERLKFHDSEMKGKIATNNNNRNNNNRNNNNSSNNGNNNNSSNNGNNNNSNNSGNNNNSNNNGNNNNSNNWGRGCQVGRHQRLDKSNSTRHAREHMDDKKFTLNSSSSSSEEEEDARNSSRNIDDKSENQHSWLTRTFIHYRSLMAPSYRNPCKSGFTIQSRNRLKMMVLLKNYEKALEEMKQQNIIRTLDGEETVFLGQKSTVFSLGLIFVELFGGLRTGLTALCHFPIITSWFSKDYAYDLIEAGYNHTVELQRQQYLRRTTTTKQSVEKDEKNSNNCTIWSEYQKMLEAKQNDSKTHINNNSLDDAEPLMTASIPSLNPYSGPSGRTIDCEFRIALGWESELIPFSAPSTTSSSLLNLDALRKIQRKRRRRFKDKEPKKCGGKNVENLNGKYKECFLSNKNNKTSTLNHSNDECNKKRKSVATDATDASTDFRRRQFQSEHLNEVEEFQNERKDNRNTPTIPIIVKSFKELYKQYCYPCEGCLSTCWVFRYKPENKNNKNNENAQQKERLLEFPIGRLIEQILDRCLEYNPVKRPSYAILKRMVHGLKLILWNLKNECIVDKWKKSSKCCGVKDIDVEIDDFGFIVINGVVYSDNDSGLNKSRKITILRTMSKAAQDCRTHPCIVDVENRFELTLDIHFD